METTEKENGSTVNEIELGNTNHEDEVPATSRRNKLLLIAGFSIFFVKAICTTSVFSYSIGYRNSLNNISKQDVQEVVADVYAPSDSALEGAVDIDKVCKKSGAFCNGLFDIYTLPDCCDGFTCMQVKNHRFSICTSCGESCPHRNHRPGMGPGMGERECCEGLKCRYNWRASEYTCEKEKKYSKCYEKNEFCNRKYENGIYKDCCDGLTCVRKYGKEWWKYSEMVSICEEKYK